MNHSGYTSRAAWIGSARYALERAGFDAAALFAARGVDIRGIDLESGRAPVELIAAAWNTVEAVTGDPAIGVRAGFAYFNASHWQSLGLAILCSSSLRDALHRVVRYHHIITDVADFELQERGDRATLKVELLVEPRLLGYNSQEFGIAAILKMLQSVYGAPVSPLALRLTRPPGEADAAFAELFGCPVAFGSTNLQVVFDAAVLDRPAPGANSALAEYQDRYSQDYLARFRSGGIVLRVREAMLRQMAGGEPTQDLVSRELHMSKRSLQRRLQDEGTSFSDLLRDLRKERARDYLRKNHALGDVAFLLGFSDHSNFTRAFKSWYGLTPSQFRDSLVASVAH